jgi:molecular chaperone GrpE
MTLLVKNIKIKGFLTKIHDYLSKMIGVDNSIQIPSDLDQTLLDNAALLHNTLKKNTNRLASALLNNDKDLNYAFETNFLGLKAMLLKSQEQLKDNDSDNNIKFNQVIDSLAANISDKILSSSNDLKNTILNSLTQLSAKYSQDSANILNALPEAGQNLQSVFASNSDSLQNAVLGIEEKLAKTILDQMESLSDSLTMYADQSTQAITQNLGSLDEKITNSSRRDRRSQQALEYLVTQQEEILHLFQNMEPQGAKGRLVDFADNFVLWLLSLEKTQNVEILSNKFNNLLQKFGLSLIADIDVPFDPEIHFACDLQRDLSKPDATVLQIISPGYFDNNKLFRTATVVVNRWSAQIDEREPDRHGESSDPISWSDADFPLGASVNQSAKTHSDGKAKQTKSLSLYFKRKKISRNLEKTSSIFYNRPSSHFNNRRRGVETSANLSVGKVAPSVLMKRITKRRGLADRIFSARKKNKSRKSKRILSRKR